MRPIHSLVVATATLALGVAAIAVAPSIANACCMVPLDYPGKIGQSQQQAVMLFADGREELILRPVYHIEPDAGEKAALPEQFVWIVTVPNEPDSYGITEDALFGEMAMASRRLLAPPRPKEWNLGCSQSKYMVAPAAAAPGRGIELGTRVQVGPYDIQPVRGVGPEAFEGLNAWLKDNGFRTEDRNHMAWFIDRKFTFLCMRVKPDAGEKAVNAAGALPPLHLSFASAKPYYPLKFSSRQGVFDLDLYALTADPLDYGKSADALTRVSWANQNDDRNRPTSLDELPPSLGKALKDAPARKAAPDRAWRFNHIHGDQMNQDMAIAKWTDDIFLTTDPNAPLGRKPWEKPMVWPWVAGSALALGWLIWRKWKRAKAPPA